MTQISDALERAKRKSHSEAPKQAEADDNALDSLGKAVTSPVHGAADPEEPTKNQPPQARSG